jgi:hypothetical protein
VEVKGNELSLQKEGEGEGSDQSLAQHGCAHFASWT